MYESYREGSIISIHLTNFQTYKNAKFSFHPRLNFIAGPNGSGKSSVANAIALVFNGKVGTIGKTRELADYIHFGADDTSILVQVKYKGADIYLKKSFNRLTKKSLHFINDKIKKQAEYMALVCELGIDVNNLCQFLPQEKVSEFASLTPEELLNQTISSVGNGKITKMKTEIKELESNKLEISNFALEISLKKDKVSKIIANISSDVNKLKEKNEKLEKIKLMQAKKSWLILELFQKQYQSIKSKTKIISTEISTKTKDLEGYRKNISRLRASPEVKKIDEKACLLKESNILLEETINHADKILNDINLLEVDRASVSKRRNSRISEIESLKLEIERMEDKYNKFSILEIEKPVSIDTKRIDQLEEKLLDLKLEDEGFRRESKTNQARFEELQKRRISLDKEENRRLEYLKKYHADTYQGVLWLRDNKNLFEDEIIEPAILNIKLKDIKYSAEVETFLGFQLLSSFICRNSRDFVKFVKILKDEKKLSINAIEDVNERKENVISKEVLKEMGFEGMMTDLIDCRPETKDFFNTLAHFHSIPVSKSDINENLIFEKFEKIKRMAIRSKFVEIKRSQYNKNDYIISESNLVNSGLFSNQSTDQINDLNEEIVSIEKRRNEITKIFREIIEKKEKISGDLKREVKKRDEYLEKVNELEREKAKKHQIELSLKRSKIQIDALSKLEVFDFEEAQIETQIQKLMLKAANEGNCIKETLKDLQFYETLKSYWKIEEEVAEQHKEIDEYVTKEKNTESDLISFTKKMEQYERERHEIKQKISHTKEKLNKDLLKDEDSRAFSRLPNTIERLEQEIAIENAKLPFYDCDPELEKDFIKRENELNKMHLDLSTLDTKMEILDQKIQSIKSACIKEIEKFLHPLCKDFKAYFSMFDCQGDAVFVHENLDSSHWQLNLMVKFRKDQKLEILKSTRQSGGEKSVSTILFLLALQNRSSVPFRLVDEINQGMDRYNEKLVHDILISLCNDEYPQFFIITPKIVPDLQYSENMRIHILFSSENLVQQSVFENAKFHVVKDS